MGHSVLLCCASAWSSPARVPRVFKHAGAHVSVFAGRAQLIARSRFVDTLIPAPAGIDEYVDALRDHLAEHSYDAVILIDDPLVDAVRLRRTEPWAAEILPIHGHHKWSGALASKAEFTRLAQVEDLPIPESRVCRTLEDTQAAARELGLPIMLKKSTSFAGIGVAKIKDLAELPEIWRHVDDDVVVAQKFLEGTIGSSLAIFSHGRLLAWASGEKVRTWPGKFGPSTARRIVTHPDIGPTFERFGAATGYHGLAATDWIIDADNNFRVIELNSRPTAMLRLGALAGTDFSAAIAEMLAGGSTTYPPSSEPADSRVVAFFPEDLMRAIAQDGFTRDEVASWLPRKGRYNDIPWGDRKVLAGYLTATLGLAIARVRLGLRR